MKLGFLIALFLTGFPAAPALSAQAHDSKITFEVASVKLAGPFVPGPQNNMRGGPGTEDPGRFTAPHTSLAGLLMQAYDVAVDQISGPAWLNGLPSAGGATFYAVDATIPPNTTKERFRLMLQNLLAERFHLTLHHETQTRPGYELVLAPGGPKLKDWTPAPGERPYLSSLANLAAETMHTTFRGSTADFCLQLGGPINGALGTTGARPRVTDKTGLTGPYEFVLDYAFTPPSFLSPPGAQPAPPGAAAMPVASDPSGDARSFFAAFEKLGLKLVKVKDVPVDVLVIDNADKVPTEN